MGSLKLSRERLTLALHAIPINARTNNHDIVDDRKATFTTYPLALAVLETTVRQNCSLVESHPSTMFQLGKRKLFGVKELPGGFVDDLIRSVAEDIDN